jgi:hypothetical protein
MRLHIDGRYWTIPGFGWRHRRIFDNAEPAPVDAVEHLWSVHGDGTGDERTWTCADSAGDLRADRVHCAVCGDLEPEEVPWYDM